MCVPGIFLLLSVSTPKKKKKKKCTGLPLMASHEIAFLTHAFRTKTQKKNASFQSWIADWSPKSEGNPTLVLFYFIEPHSCKTTVSSGDNFKKPGVLLLINGEI